MGRILNSIYSFLTGEVDAFTLISGHEGLRLRLYTDNDGSQTIGYGYHINTTPLTLENELIERHEVSTIKEVWAEGITIAEAQLLLEDRITSIQNTLDDLFPWYSSLSLTRRSVITDMVYEMGIGSAEQGTGFLGFKSLIKYLKAGNYPSAFLEMGNSQWAEQVPAREQNDAKLMLEG